MKDDQKMIEFFLIFFLIVFIFSFVSGYAKNNKRSSSEFPEKIKRNASIIVKSHAENIKTPIPKGFVIFEPNLQISGIQFHKEAALKFIKSSNKRLTLEADPLNEYDKNAIKVLGLCAAGSKMLGFVPKEVATSLIKTGLIDKTEPRLIRVFQNNNFIEIQFQVIGEKSLKSTYQAYFRNIPANNWQLLFYEFFNQTISENLTVGDADIFIKEFSSRLNAENPSKIVEFEAYVDILNELSSDSLEEDYPIKKPTHDEINLVLNDLISRGYSYIALQADVDLIIEELCKSHPKIVL